MLKQLSLAVALGGIAVLAAVPAEARINQRQNHQQQRIHQGVKHGGLTAHETYRLERQQAHIAGYEARSRADGGGLSAKERVRLEHMQDRASKNIYHQKHDRQGR
jgi:hypothetical protein